MAEQLVRGGAPLDIPTADETAAAVDARHRAFWHEQRQIQEARELELARGIKFLRLPPNLQGKPSASAITLGITKGQVPVGPEQGWIWSIRELIVTGLTASSSAPDIVNLYLNDNFGGPIWWQLNGNTFGYTFAMGDKMLMPGETLSLQNSGSIAATGLITLSGSYWQVPAEMQYKLAGAGV